MAKATIELLKSAEWLASEVILRFAGSRQVSSSKMLVDTGEDGGCSLKPDQKG